VPDASRSWATSRGARLRSTARPVKFDAGGRFRSGQSHARRSDNELNPRASRPMLCLNIRPFVGYSRTGSNQISAYPGAGSSRNSTAGSKGGSGRFARGRALAAGHRAGKHPRRRLGRISGPVREWPTFRTATRNLLRRSSEAPNHLETTSNGHGRVDLDTTPAGAGPREGHFPDNSDKSVTSSTIALRTLGSSIAL